MSSPKRHHHTKSSSRTWARESRASGQPADENGQATENQDPSNGYSRPPQAFTRQPSFNVERIGDVLRSTRERRGENLYVISDFLRIRPSFLAALENSHYEELPADAYVIGFLRSYAAYLGLDSKAAIDQYRREMAGHRHKPQLHMPQPISEGRAPTVAILIGATIAALLLYALWYGLSSSSRTEIDTPPPLSQTTSESSEISTSALPPSTEAVTTAEITTASKASEPTLPAAASSTTVLTPATTKETSFTSNLSPATSSETSLLKSASSITAMPQPLPMPVTPDVGSKEKPKLDNSIRQEPLPPLSAVDSQNAASAPAADSARLMIRADKESWVLVTDRKGNTLFDKILNPGESYSVPNIKGLRLTTGNGGGIVLNLDGVDLPRLSEESRIVRNVPLDPDKVKVHKASPGE